jgi:hypothetical protein
MRHSIRGCQHSSDNLMVPNVTCAVPLATMEHQYSLSLRCLW